MDPYGWWLLAMDLGAGGTLRARLKIDSAAGNRFRARAPFAYYRRVLPRGRYWRCVLLSGSVRSRATISVTRGIVHASGDTVELVGRAATIVGRMSFRATLDSETLRGTLTGPEITANFTGERLTDSHPVSAFEEPARQIERCLRQHLFDPGLLETPEFRFFFDGLTGVAPRLGDELQFLASVRVLASQLPVSHLGLRRSAVASEETEEGFAVEPLTPATTLLTVTTFSVADLPAWDRAMDDLVARGVANLIVDLRRCAGGDYSAMALASYLVDEPDCPGYLLGRRHFEARAGAPDVTVLAAAPVFSGASREELDGLLRNHGVVAGRVTPSAIRFRGKVYVLTGPETASAAEALVDYLKSRDLATLVGETTAGAMLSSDEFAVGDDWVLTLPVAQYLTSAGRSIEGEGVEPHESVPVEDALEVVAARTGAAAAG